MPGCSRALDKSRYAGLLLGGNERAHLHAGLGLHSDFQRAYGIAEIGNEFVVDLGAGVDAARRRAVLAGVVEAERAYSGDDRIEVRIIEHDDRGLAAEFE